jgi:hypothetical protein
MVWHGLLYGFILGVGKRVGKAAFLTPSKGVSMSNQKR